MRNTKLIGGIICLSAALFYVYDYFVQVAPSVMVPDLMRSFHIDARSLGVLSACFFYAYAVMQIPAGWLLDRFGARKILSFAVFVSAVGVIVFSQAHLFWQAGGGRFLIGLGSAFAFISTLHLISRWFSHKYFATLAGFVQLGACVGAIIGLAPVALLVDRYGWRQSMFVTGALTLVCAGFFWVIIRNGPRVAAAAHQPTSFAAIKKLLFQRQIFSVCLCGLLSWVPVAGVGALWGVPYMMKVYHITNAAAGEYIAFFWLGIGLGSPLVGWLSLHFSRRRIPTILCFCCALIASLLLIEAPHMPIMMSVFALFLLGFSASSQSLTFGIVKDIVPDHQFGVVAGLVNMSAIIGGGIAQPLIGIVLHYLWNGQYANGAPAYTLMNYRDSLFILPIIALLGIGVATLLLKETFKETLGVNPGDSPVTS